MKVNFSNNYQYQKLTRLRTGNNNDVTSIVYNSNRTKEWIGQTAVSFGTSSNYLYVLGGSYRDGMTVLLKTHPQTPNFDLKQNNSLRRIRLKPIVCATIHTAGGAGVLNGKMMYVTMVAIDGAAVGASYERDCMLLWGKWC